MSVYFAHVLFEKALTNLYENQAFYKKMKSSLPWSDLIISFNMHLKNECQRFNETSYFNLGNALTGNSSDYPFKDFLKKEFEYVQTYNREFKEILSKYSEAFTQTDYCIKDWKDLKLVSFRLRYLLLQFMYEVTKDNIQHKHSIDEFKSLLNPSTWDVHENFLTFWYRLEPQLSSHANLQSMVEFLTAFIKSQHPSEIEDLSKELENVDLMTPAKRVRMDLTKYKYQPRLKKDLPKVEVEPKVEPKVKPKVEVEPKVKPKVEVEPKVKPKVEVPASVPRKKAKIPSAVRVIVWNTYMGTDIASGKCLVCNFETISITNFECGHVHAECQGGETIINNLRPICGHCNKSIGGNNMEDFMMRYGIEKPKNWDGIGN
jgi:hypothetical protein